MYIKMKKRQSSDVDILIEQCLSDAYCERTGDMIDESLASWFAGKKAKLGAAANNIKTGIANAGKTIGNAAVVAGRGVKTGLNNAKKGITHNVKQGARQLASAGLNKIGATSAAAEVDAKRQAAANNFSYDKVDTSDKFQKGAYADTNAAEQNAQRVTLAKQISELLGQFKQAGGKIPKVGIDSLVNYLNSVQ